MDWSRLSQDQMNFTFWPSWPEMEKKPHPPVLISRLIVTPLFIKSVAPDGVLRIRICALRKAANRLMEEGFFKLFQGIVRFFPSTCAREIQALRRFYQ